MDLSEYVIQADVGNFEIIHEPTGQSLLVTQVISFDTLMRIAVADNAKRRGISL